MKAAFNIPISIHFNFTVLLTLTAIVCLAAIQTFGSNSSIPIATAAAILVFYSRQSLPTNWELLMHVYLLRTSQSKRW